MANSNKNPNRLLNMLRNLNSATKATNVQTYGVSKDPSQIIDDEMERYDEELRNRNNVDDADKRVINSNIARFKIAAQRPPREIKNLYDIIRDQQMLNGIQSLIGTENIKFAQTLKDYEIIKRCLPQIHKVIVTLKNNILAPDGIEDIDINVELSPSTNASDKEGILALVDKYELYDKLQDWIMDYLIASVKYVLVVPYNEIPEMLRNADSANLTESINPEEYKYKTLLEASGSVECAFDSGITISYPIMENDECVGVSDKIDIGSDILNNALNEALGDIEFVDGGAEYFKKEIMNEAIFISKNLEDEDKSLKSIVKRLKTIHKDDKNDDLSHAHKFADASESFIEEKTIKDIEKKVKFKGCHVEEIPASKVIPFKIRDTLIGYFYVEDKYSNIGNNSNTSNLSTIMDKINSSVFMHNTTKDDAAKVEATVVKTITDKLMKAINYKFINDNYDDINIIYEFVKENLLYNQKKRIIFFHPDDMCEIKRKDGSIMKNCMFLAKLYLLTLLSNVITNVTRGADRQMYYVKSGLTSDIEGSVNSTIRAIKQNQIRYSDIGTINEIFNIVGSMVDVFMPVSIDGDRPIETETISGQNVDMNNDFLQWMMKSIIQSFGVPSSVIDDFENIDFARTIAASNLDMARAAMDAQKEIEPVLTKIFKHIVECEFPNYQYIDSIKCKLPRPSVIIFNMNRERIDSVNTMADTLVQMLFGPDGEAEADKRVRLFKLEYFKANMPGLDWPKIENIATKAILEAHKETKISEIEQSEDGSNGGDIYGGYGNDEYGGDNNGGGQNLDF